MGDDELKILIEASLDEVKSIQNILADLKRLQNEVKAYRLKVLAGLDKTASSAQIKSDLAQITKTKSKVKIVGEVDKPTTRKNVDSAIKNLKNAEVKLTGVLDASATQKNVQQQLGQIPKVETTANVKVNGGDEVDELRSQMDSAKTSAAGMAAQLYVARSALQLLRRTAVEAKEIIIDLDSAATDLALATGANSEEAYKLLEQYNALGKRLGATTSQVAESATEWLRQGRSAAETSALIEQSMILSKVGAMSADEATKNLTSTMKGFKLEVEDVAGVVDRLTALDLKAAVTSADLATAVARTASSANLAGVGLDKLLGYITVVEETTQKSAETIGESFKTIFARMGNIKLGKFLDDDGEDLSDVEKILNNFGIALRKSNDQFREFDDVLDEVASRWSDFTNVEQSAIATTIAGTRQRENFLVLMENYGKALEYTGVAAESAGTALQKFAAYEDSIEAKAASFVAAVEGLTMDTIDSDLVKELIDGATAVIEFAEAAGLLRATLLSLGAGATLKGVQMIATGFKNVSQHVLNMGEAATILRKIGDVSALSGEQIKRLGVLTKGLSDSQLNLILSSQNLSTAQMQAVLQASGLTSAEAAQKIQTLGLATAQQTTAGATWSLTAALNGLKVAIMSNPIGALMTAIAAATVVFSLVSNAIEDAKQKEEDARQKMLEVADAAKEEADAISDLYDIYAQANKAYQDGVGSKDDLTSATDSLLEVLGYEKGAVSDLISEYGSLEQAIDGVTKKSLEQKAASILEGYDAAKQTALNAAEDSMGWFSGSTITVKTNGDDKKFAELLQKAGYLGNGDLPLLSTSLYTGINNYGDIDSLVEGYEKLLAIKELLESGIGNGYSAEELSGAGVYTDVVAKINAVSEEIEAYRDIIKAYNETQAQIAYMDFAEANGVPETREEYDALKQSLLDAAEASGKYIGSQDEIEAAITNVLATRPALQEFFTTSTKTAEGVALYKAQLSELTDVISSLQSSYNALDAAQSDMVDGGGLSPETIEKLAKAESNYLDYIYEENGVVKLNTEAWKENANAKMQTEMSEIQKEIDSLEEQNAVLRENIALYNEKAYDTDNIAEMDSYFRLVNEATAELEANTTAIEANQAKLALYGSIYGDITGDMDAYRSALANFSSVASTIDTISGSFQTLANLQAEVANGFTMSLDKALEFAKVYPEILNSAQVTADGQISLNEDVVNSFIKGKKAELDAQIDSEVAQLEADKTVLQAKMEAAQAQLDLAKAVAEGEGDISKELAEYRINAGNAVAQALIDAGIDEATAFKLAAAAMAQNAEEFDRVAMEVCTDVNGNFNQAAFDLAQTMYKNLTNVKTDLASVAKQAHETAKAIAGVANGDSKAGSSAIQGGSGGGTGGSNIKLNLTSGSFEGTEYTYTAKESGLEDFISQIELDISNYQDAISQIDGQIATLKALKNLPLSSFKGKSSSGGSGSNSSKKEVEEYTATIEDYREAVERLRKAQEDVNSIKTTIDESDDLKEKILLEKQLISAYQREQEALHNLNNLRDNTITNGVAALRELGFVVEYNADTNELWIENMERLNELTADSKGEYGSLQEATNALRKNTEDLIGTLENLNEENQKGSSTWRELKNSIKDAKIAIVNDLQDIVDQASDAVDEIQNVADTLYGAADEFAANDGFITIDTWQALRKVGMQYMQLLKDENGVYEINEERINAVIAARTRQMAVENAMSYVERIKLATQEGAVENLNDLIFVTTDATNSTWGLVYAELELMHTMGDLNDSQYQAALHNIQAMQDLAENAIQNIGKDTGAVATNLEETRKQLESTKDGLKDLLDELEDMQDGAGDLVDYVMEMLKHRIQQQINLLDEMKDKYSEIIDLKKKSLDATKDEQDYQKTIAKKLKEMAKLQERINALSLDDSRSAQAERTKLLEEMAELQEDLADSQSDKSIEAQKEALDQMEKDYHEEKDNEIKILEDSISSTLKLYSMAISYIRDNWDTLYSELIAWNTEYGTSLNSEIDAAWEAAQAAAQRYGDFVSAIMGGISAEIDGITRQIEALDEQMSNLSTSTSSGGGVVGESDAGNKNTTVGNRAEHTSPTSEDMVRTIVGRMKEYGAAWNRNNDKATNDALHQKAVDLAQQLNQYGVYADFRDSDGTWWITQDKLNPSNVGKLLHSCYHTRGFVGDEPLKPNERYIKAENGELVLTSDQQDSFAARIDQISAMTEKFINTPLPMAQPILPDFSHLSNSTVNNVTNSSSSQPVTINQGDVIIQGTVMGPKELAENINKYINMTEKMVNQYARLTGVKW